MTPEQLEKEEEDRLIAEYLANGGKVTVFPAGERTDPELIGNVWSRKPAKKAVDKPKK